VRHWFERFTRRDLHLVDPYDEGCDKALTPPDRVLPYLRSNLAPLRLVMGLSILFTIITAVIEVWLISYAGQLIDRLADTPPAQIWEVHKLPLIGAALTLLLLRPAAQFVRHTLNGVGLDCNIVNLYRWRAHAHLSQQSVGWFQEDLTGRTSIRLVEMGNYTASTIFNSLNTLAFGLVYMIGIITLLAGEDPRLSLPILAWVVLYIWLMTRIVPRMIRAQQLFQAAKSGLVGSVVDTFSNFDTVKLFSRSDVMASDHKARLEHTRETLFKSRQIAIALRTTIVILEGIIMVGFIGYGIWMWSAGIASIGLVGSAIALTLRITTMADWVLDAVWSIFLSVGSIREALKTLAQPIVIPQVDGAPALEVTRGGIEITDLRHQYGAGQGGLNGVSLSVKPGEKIGIVGRSGAGRSSLVNLILRYFEAEQGTIRIDGQSIRDVEQDSLRSAIGMVSQQASLLNRSVRDNIAMGRPGASDAEIAAAAEKAEAHDFIKGLKDQAGRTGYDAHVGERGVKLSGGQRQRIALARVILKDAPILILDEATSALDSEVEAAIQAALHDVMADKTVIAIAHRLSTIARMDRIVVLENGRIIEDGSHEELLARQGAHAEFWAHQSCGFLKVDRS
jgi:ATP-binding cassette subfamily B multidrug efflux pump